MNSKSVTIEGVTFTGLITLYSNISVMKIYDSNSLTIKNCIIGALTYHTSSANTLFYDINNLST